MTLQTSSLALAAGLTRDYLLHHRMCPTPIDGEGALVIAVTDHSRLSGADDIAFAYRSGSALETVPHEELDRLIERLTTRSERTIELARIDHSAADATADAATWQTNRPSSAT